MVPDRWLALTVRLAPGTEGAPASELVPDLLMELGGRGVEEKNGTFTTYLVPPEDLERVLRTAADGLRGVGLPHAELRWDWQAHEDWETLWRRGLGPRRVTDRLVVAPTWEVPDVGDGDLLILLDPGMAFGTAEHATTRGCLRLLARRVGEGDAIADVGSGSGILSIAAALLGAGRVLAVEVDPMACEAARENLIANRVQDRVRILEEEVDGREPLPDGPYSGLVANIQRLILLPLLPGFRASLEEGGWLVLSGILLSERDEVVSVAAGFGFLMEEEDQEEEWWSGAFRLPGSQG